MSTFEHHLTRLNANGQEYELDIDVEIQYRPGRNGPSGFYFDPREGNYTNDDPDTFEILSVKDRDGRLIELTNEELQEVEEAFLQTA